MKRIVECIPNFSEGRNIEVIEEITRAIESVEGVRLLDIDTGRAANRTVVTFAGEPEQVAEAAFRGIKKASEVIDMSKHHGVHPRIGATDVCPLVPVAGITMEETAGLARGLAKRTGEELGIPVYCYGQAAFYDERQSLANCRSGQYEGLRNKMTSEKWKPDFGPSVWSDKIARTGAAIVGARNYLVAYNINLDTTSAAIANDIAMDVRESGRIARRGDSRTGEIVTDGSGNPLRIPGTLQKARAIGWYIEEYGIAQVSMNLTDISVTPLHAAYEEVSKKANERGISVTGSELVGLIPLQALVDAGKYFLRKQQRSINAPDGLVIHAAVKSLGLDELRPFDPERKIIEYLIKNKWNSE